MYPFFDNLTYNTRNSHQDYNLNSEEVNQIMRLKEFLWTQRNKINDTLKYLDRSIVEFDKLSVTTKTNQLIEASKLLGRIIDLLEEVKYFCVLNQLSYDVGKAILKQQNPIAEQTFYMWHYPLTSWCTTTISKLNNLYNTFLNKYNSLKQQ